MKQMKRRIKAGAALAGICTLLLAGCGGQNPLYEMQDAMTKMSEKEASFEKEQGALQSYEKKSSSCIKK
ncbi:hypothetical protein ACTWKB_10430 [Bacillus sp. 4A_MP2]